MSDQRRFFVRCARTGRYASNRKHRPMWVTLAYARALLRWEAEALANDPVLWRAGVPVVVEGDVELPVKRDMRPRFVKALRPQEGTLCPSSAE